MAIGIKKILTKHEDRSLQCLKIKVGVDGVKLTKSSNAQFWPILATLEPFDDIILVGVYFGFEKPKFEEEFLEDFLAVVESLCDDGLECRGQILTCEIVCIICDAPAKSFLLNIKGHTVYYSCPN